jgi:Mrp family chromosome partitioning ATPase
LAVLASGLADEKEALDLSYDSLGALLEDKFNQFGYLVFDLPVADDLSPFFSIAPHLSGVILAVDSGQIDERQIQRARRRFTEYGIQIIGIVINRS